MTSPTPPAALVSWAHKNTAWAPEQEQSWENAVRSLVECLRAKGVDAHVDLYYQSDSSIDWTRWGQKMVRDSDFVIVAVSTAWKQRWEGTNEPTVGAGAVVEADTLKGRFNKNQHEFQQKTLIVMLPGVSDEDLPADLYRLNRFYIKEFTDTDDGIQRLLRMLHKRPLHVLPELGLLPDLPPERSALSPKLIPAESSSLQSPARGRATGGIGGPEPSGNTATRDISVVGNGNTVTVGGYHVHNTHITTTATTPYEKADRNEYLDRLNSASRSRLEHRRLGAGLSPEQVARTLTERVRVPQQLDELIASDYRLLVGPLGSGKSDIAEEWFRCRIEDAKKNPTAPVPVWVPVRDLDGQISDHIVSEVGLDALTGLGADVVVDGLDERTDEAATVLRQASEFVAKWPKSRIILTSRTQEKVTKRVVPVPMLTRSSAERLMRLVAGRPIGGLGRHLEEAVERPFFALLVALHASAVEGTTGVPELIDLVVEDVVAAEGHNLYTGLRRLAVETIRSGKAVDPARFTTTDVAVQIRKSSLVTTTGRKCNFSLTIYEQWFAAKALLEGEESVDELLTSLRAFDRWKYVLAMVLAAGEPTRVDPVMAAVARWNPGAASWVIDETHSGGLSHTAPDFEPDDWEEVGHRLRTATAAWLDGLGPLAEAFFLFSAAEAQDLDEVTVAVNIDCSKLAVSWMVSDVGTNDVLPSVISGNLPMDRSRVSRSHAVPTGLNWVWEISRDHLADDVAQRFLGIALRIGQQQPGVVQREVHDGTRIRNAQFALPGQLEADPEAIAPLYPEGDIAPTYATPWWSFTPERMLDRVQQVITAAMTCYLELAETVTPRFGDTLGHRGLMPAEFYGNVSHDPTRERSPFEFPGLDEPGIRWLLKPTGTPSPDGRRPGFNTVSLTLNDEARIKEIDDDRDALYSSFRAYVEAYPPYEAFAPNFSTHSGRFDMHSATPATRLALSWLWEDLTELGWVEGHFPSSW
ncbi:hypothetical protein [Rhodococcus maanshanensis]|uniref:SEFIR domain-containing protein n=1 Tax=Rhodococcus maanshanensis TaxID=183556 RepID=A0A1H7V316_9NOCA|nr:hypothetical protein [Rhodococcus maanshanensis]SEM03546.1 hypothetical protein SAMN05444583_12064 [Rhodococcus maanshanensis]